MKVLKMFSLLTAVLLLMACDENSQNQNSNEINWHPLGIATDASTGEPSLNLDIILECRKVISEDLIFYYQVRSLEENRNNNSNVFNADLVIWRYYEDKNSTGTPILFNSEVDVKITRVMNGNTFYEVLANAKTEEQGPLKPVVLSSNSASIKSGISNVNSGERLFNMFHNYQKGSNLMTTKNDFLGFYENEIKQDTPVECK